MANLSSSTGARGGRKEMMGGVEGEGGVTEEGKGGDAESGSGG